MKFVDFLILKENLKPSIDDNSVLTKLNDLNIVKPASDSLNLLLL